MAVAAVTSDVGALDLGLRIVDVLGPGPLGAVQIAGRLRVPVTDVYETLALMRQAGIVDRSSGAPSRRRPRTTWHLVEI